VESKLDPVGTSATEWPIVPTPGDYDDGEFGGMKISRGNRRTRRKPAPAPLCPPQIPLHQTRARTRAVAVGSQRLTAWAMTWPLSHDGANIASGIDLDPKLNSPYYLHCRKPTKLKQNGELAHEQHFPTWRLPRQKMRTECLRWDK
jgi:hypothetical protein